MSDIRPEIFMAGFCRRLTGDMSAAMSTGAYFRMGCPHLTVTPLRSHACVRMYAPR